MIPQESRKILGKVPRERFKCLPARMTAAGQYKPDVPWLHTAFTLSLEKPCNPAPSTGFVFPDEFALLANLVLDDCQWPLFHLKENL